jgi:hypothetical protein
MANLFTEEIKITKNEPFSRTYQKIMNNRKAKIKKKMDSMLKIGSQISSKSARLKNKENKEREEFDDDKKYLALYNNYMNLRGDFDDYFNGSLLEENLNTNNSPSLLPEEKKIISYRLSIAKYYFYSQAKPSLRNIKNLLFPF